MSDVLIEASAVRKYFSRNDKVTRSEVGSIALSALLGRRSNKIPTALDEDGFAALDNIIAFLVISANAFGVFNNSGIEEPICSNPNKTSLPNILVALATSIACCSKILRFLPVAPVIELTDIKDSL